MRRSPNAAQCAYLEGLASAGSPSAPMPAALASPAAAPVSGHTPFAPASVETGASATHPSPAVADTSPVPIPAPAAVGPVPTAAPSPAVASTPTPARPTILFRSVPVSSASASAEREAAADPTSNREPLQPGVPHDLTWAKDRAWLRECVRWLLPLLFLALLSAVAARGAEPATPMAPVSASPPENAAPGETSDRPVPAGQELPSASTSGMTSPPGKAQPSGGNAPTPLTGPAVPTLDRKESPLIGLMFSAGGAALLIGFSILVLACKSGTGNRSGDGSGRTENAGSGNEEQPGASTGGREVPIEALPTTIGDDGSREDVSVPPAPWTIGFATHPGLVRHRNEDTGAAFSVGEHRVAIVADGLGGMPLGAEASALAVRAAEESIRGGWRLTPPDRGPAPAILLHAAIAPRRKPLRPRDCGAGSSRRVMGCAPR
jgi:hypothetical protein